MNSEKVIFAFFIVFAMTLNFGFFIGEMDQVNHHSEYELFAAIIINLIATVLKFGDRTHLGAVFLATSLVAVIQLLAAAIIWGLGETVFETSSGGDWLPIVVSLSGGALMANIISVILLVAETLSVRR